jgi:hypothetical protein
MPDDLEAGILVGRPYDVGRTNVYAERSAASQAHDVVVMARVSLKLETGDLAVLKVHLIGEADLREKRKVAIYGVETYVGVLISDFSEHLSGAHRSFRLA